MMRSLRTHAAREAVLVLMLALLASCGGRSKAASTAAHLATTTHEALNASRDVFVAWDAQHQLDLVEQATSLEDGQARLADYRAKRQVVYASFQLVYGAIAQLAVLVPLLEAGKATSMELMAASAELARGLAEMRDAVKSIMGAT